MDFRRLTTQGLFDYSLVVRFFARTLFFFFHKYYHPFEDVPDRRRTYRSQLIQKLDRIYAQIQLVIN